MAKNQNTFEKRQREMEKKRKADEKRARKKLRKEMPEGYTPEPRPSDDPLAAFSTPDE